MKDIYDQDRCNLCSERLVPICWALYWIRLSASNTKWRGKRGRPTITQSSISLALTKPKIKFSANGLTSQIKQANKRWYTIVSSGIRASRVEFLAVPIRHKLPPIRSLALLPLIRQCSDRFLQLIPVQFGFLPLYLIGLCSHYYCLQKR